MFSRHHNIILASQSPRRRKLIHLIVESPSYLKVDSDENIFPKEAPHKAVQRIAADKLEIARKSHKQGIIITADTLVVLDGKILGKPKNTSDAFTMLMTLSNRTHTVYTGFAVCNSANGRRAIGYEKTRVTFRQLGEEEIRRYVASGSPMDKAGSYGIQDDYGAVFVKKISGCYYNVVGLPLSRIYESISSVISE